MQNFTEIKTLLKHRDPFLFVDTVDEVHPKSIDTSYLLEQSHPILAGHFPGDPIMPGVLLIEGIAQSAGILILYNIIQQKKCKPNELNHDSFLVKINSIKFKKKVIPNSKIQFKVSLSPVMRDFYDAVGQVYVNQKLVAVGGVTLYFKLI